MRLLFFIVPCFVIGVIKLFRKTVCILDNLGDSFFKMMKKLKTESKHNLFYGFLCIGITTMHFLLLLYSGFNGNINAFDFLIYIIGFVFVIFIDGGIDIVVALAVIVAMSPIIFAGVLLRKIIVKFG